MDFEFWKDYILENDLVQLIPLEEKHREDLLPFSLHEPELWKYSLLGAEGEENLKKYIDFAITSRNHGTAYPFVVWDKKTGRFAGSTRFYDISLSQKTLSIGFTWYGKDFQGTGLNKACKYLLLEFAFEKMGMERVEFRADARNLRSLAAMKSIGCTMEGTLRSNGIGNDGGRRDSAVLSILKREWEGKIKTGLALKF
ncbi:MAG: GNAT family N-acetyltransferase [Leadbetterella sp.]|nr:GNAT family N-acetyltransferase [Leadbetterella sp.]